MELDFSRLNDLTSNENNSRPIEIPNGLKQFQSESDKITEVYATYQDNIKKSGQLITDIIKGLQSGIDIYDLFLKAVECVGFCTGDTTLRDVCENHLEIVYGYGGESDSPLEMTLRAAETRLERLNAVRGTPKTNPDTIERLDAAIRTHRELIERLRVI